MGFEKKIMMSIKSNQLILSLPINKLGDQLDLSAQKIAQAGEDQLVIGKFSNESDRGLVW
jgi:hypothetical protein